MREEVKVLIETTHHHQEDKEVFRHSGKGRYFFKREQHFVEYQAIEEGKEVRYLLKFNHNELALTKTSEQGRYMMELWDKGKTKFNYQTPFGILQVHIFVHNLHIDIQDKDIHLSARYDLLSEGDEQILCDMKIRIYED